MLPRAPVLPESETESAPWLTWEERLPLSGADPWAPLTLTGTKDLGKMRPHKRTVSSRDGEFQEA